jgi:hypothetical protein
MRNLFCHYKSSLFLNDRRMIAISSEVGVEMPNKKTPAAVEETLTGLGNGEMFLPHSFI